MGHDQIRADAAARGVGASPHPAGRVPKALNAPNTSNSIFGVGGHHTGDRHGRLGGVVRRTARIFAARAFQTG